MEKKEVLEKVSSKKALVGEMEKDKMNKGFLISMIVSGIVAVAFIVLECAFGHFTGAFALGTVCYLWASVQYTMQYCLAKRPWPVLIGSVLDGLAAVACAVFYILFTMGIL